MKQMSANPNDKEADLDFNTFNLGNGPLTDKKKRLAAYVQNIMADKKNVKNCNETIRRILDHRQMKNFENKEDSLMFQGVGGEQDYDDLDPNQTSVFYNNNFVQRNANIMPFYRDHDTEKRVAFVKIRDKLIELAKANRLQQLEEKRQVRIQSLNKWDHYKKAKDKIMEQKTKFR